MTAYHCTLHDAYAYFLNGFLVTQLFLNFQVSERWKEKEQTGELHSELERIEFQSKINVEDRAAEAMGRRRGRNRQRENGDIEEEGGDQNEVVENGEVMLSFCFILHRVSQKQFPESIVKS